MRNIAIRLRFDGTHYHGWQVQKTQITVAETIENALSSLCGHTAKLIGCGRTDAGVHAISYCANFKTDCKIPADKIALALNSKLPLDIAAVDAREVPEDFNAISACIKKEYVYKIHNSKLRCPFLNKRACFFPARLDIERMAFAAKAFEGKHDFSAMRSAGTETKTTVRTVYWCDVEKSGELIIISMCADGFLYNMARAIAGTLVYAGLGKLEPCEISAILHTKDRSLAGPTMPPEGLYMSRVWYDGPVGEMMLS